MLSFPTIAIQFTIMDIASPVNAGLAYGAITIPWCLKPSFGYISDRFPVFNWGKRRPYIFFASLLSSFCYIHVYDFKDSFLSFVAILTIISGCICITDVCADSITVQYAKEEDENGVTQSNTWISRGTGTLLGFVLGGLLYKATSASNVLTFCSYIPLITCFIVWNIKEYPTRIPKLRDVWLNIKREKNFLIILFMFHISPNYRVFYEYYLREKMDYDSDEFTYLSIISSLSFVFGLISFKFYFRKFELTNLLWKAVIVSSLLRCTQIGVIFGILPYFEIVMIDGIVESFCGQLIMMPLTVVAAKICDEGVEGSFFSFVMSIMNFAVFLADETGAAIAHILGVTKKNFDRLYILMLIGIIIDVIIPFVLLKKMSFYFNTYVNDEIDINLEPLDPQDVEGACPDRQKVKEKTVYTLEHQD